MALKVDPMVEQANELDLTRPSSPEPVIGVVDELPAPDGGYGWICVAAVFLINAHSLGISTSYSVFLAHYLSNSTINGASSLDYAFLGGFTWAFVLLIAPVAVLVMRYFGLRTCLLCGVVLECGSLIGASFASEMWHLYLGQGIGFAFGVGFFLIATQSVIPQWFHRRRGLAVGMAVSGTGIGGLVYALAAAQLIEELGSGLALRILAIIAGCVTAVCSLLLRDRNKQTGTSLAIWDFNLLKRLDFDLLCTYSILNMLGEIIILTELVSYAQTIIGLNSTQGSVIGAMICLGQILGRLSIGYASDLFGRLNMAAFAALMAGLCSVIIWPNAHSYGVMILFCILVGAFAGSFWATIAPVTTEVVGLDVLPTALSMILLIIVVPSFFSPVIGLEMYTTLDPSYLSTQMFAGFMYIGSALFAWVLRCHRIHVMMSEENRQEGLPSKGFSWKLLFAAVKV